MARSGGGINQRRLSRKMDSCSKDLTTADHLRSTFRKFERSSKNVLLVNVRKILKSKRLKEEDDGNSCDQDKRKKQRKNKEHRSVYSEEEEDSCDVSTSEDASPRFDLINTSSEKPIVEVETVTNNNKGGSSSKMTTTMGLLRKEDRSVSGITGDVDLEAVEHQSLPKMNCEGFSGADLANLMDKAIRLAVEERFSSIELSEGDGVIDTSECTIKVTHIQEAVTLVSSSVSKTANKTLRGATK